MPKKESLDVNAKTVDEAIEQGLQQLNLTRDQVDIEIISEGKRGLFGINAEDAQVRLTPKSQAQEDVAPDDEAAPAESAEATEETTAEAPDEAIAEEEADETDEAEETPAPGEAAADEELDDFSKEVAQVGTKYLAGLLERMGIDAEVTTRIAPDLVEPDEQPPLVLDVKGKDLGILIGRRNETLQALQFMVRLMVNKHFGRWQSLVVDVESYRSRRRQSLQQMAARMAERAVANSERVVLEAMPAYERRIVHIALRDHPDVFTKSIGHDKNRKVTIIPK